MFKTHILNVLLFSFILLSCEIDFDDIENTRQRNLSSNIEDRPDQVAYNIEVLFVDSSFTKAVLQARKARVYSDRYETFLDSGLKVTFYNRNSTETSTLVADSARIDDRTKNMLAKGNVIVRSESKGRRLDTHLLEWDNLRQKIYSTEYVTITTPNEIINGYGFESDPNLNEYRITKVSGIQRRTM
jgi:LPS export ABC transporter protein LptC